MDIRPIFTTLRRHKFTACLLILEIALTCAIICNAIFLINQRLESMRVVSGVAEQELVYVKTAYIGARPDAPARVAADVSALRSISGVRAATLVDQLPFDGGSDNVGLRLTLDQREDTLNAAMYYGEDLLHVLGAKLVEGRDFRPEEYAPMYKVAEALDKGELGDVPMPTIISRAAADRLWPGQEALGKQVYIGRNVPLTVVGVVGTLVRPSEFQMAKGPQYSMVVPIQESTAEGSVYVLRTAPQDRDRVLKAAVVKLMALDPNRIVLEKGAMEQHRRDFFQNDRAMATILVAVCIAMLIITALGIVGLASFWVSQRNHSIGVRRALGATRSNILNYFQTENFLLTTMGIVFGMVLAYGINLFLIVHYELPRLPLIYLPIGAALLWLIGQCAVLGPAMRAAAVPPVVATRSV
jgi:putative ABC transport system permease protein